MIFMNIRTEVIGKIYPRVGMKTWKQRSKETGKNHDELVGAHHMTAVSLMFNWCCQVLKVPPLLQSRAKVEKRQARRQTTNIFAASLLNRVTTPVSFLIP